MRAALLIVATVGGLWSTGCASNRCDNDGDCFVPEVCVARRCEVPVVEDTAVADVGTIDTSRGEPDASRPVDMNSTPDAASTDDMIVVDAAMPDLGAADMSRPDVSITSCEVDVFAFMCSDDAYEPNNTAFNGTRLSDETYGCPVGDFKPFLADVEGTICPVDGTDWYRFNFVACEDAAYIIELQLELLSDCDPQVVGLQTPQFDCADELVDCTIEDGKPTLRAIVERTNLVVFRSMYVEVHNKMQDVTFDYRLSVEVRR